MDFGPKQSGWLINQLGDGARRPATPFVFAIIFAFTNKVLDCRILKIRDIRPNDYIMNNTGHVYSEYIDEDLKPYKDALSLNGERLF